MSNESFATAAPNTTCTWAPDPHQLIQDRIDYHKRMSNNLSALYRALPRELPREAADALATVLLEARPRY